MKKIILTLLLILFTSFIRSMNDSQSDNQKLSVYAIPGQNGLGSHPEYIEDLLYNINVIPVGTPSIPDLGQNSCIEHLRMSVSKNKKPGLIHATSQGTATALNYLIKDQGKIIKCLILEAVLASGNRGIEHTISGPLMPTLNRYAKWPLSYYWIPYGAKAMFPFYWPAGKQPIKSIAKIPTNIPIIIVHSKGDMQLSYDDACALYYGLKENGNPTYLISLRGMNHIHLLKNFDDRNAIRSILKKHNLLRESNLVKGHQHNDNLEVYQPDHKPFEKLYDNILYKEKMHEQLSVLLVVGSFCLLVKIVMSYF